MAASTWTTTKGPSGVRYHSTTVSTTDGSDILALDVRSRISVMINHGGTDSLSYRTSNVPSAAAANMVATASAITADYTDAILGPITAIDFDSDGTASHVITIAEVPYGFGKN